jgi:hypothetical protein
VDRGTRTVTTTTHSGDVYTKSSYSSYDDPSYDSTDSGERSSSTREVRVRSSPPRRPKSATRHGMQRRPTAVSRVGTVFNGKPYRTFHPDKDTHGRERRRIIANTNRETIDALLDEIERTRENTHDLLELASRREERHGPFDTPRSVAQEGVTVRITKLSGKHAKVAALGLLASMQPAGEAAAAPLVQQHSPQPNNETALPVTDRQQPPHRRRMDDDVSLSSSSQPKYAPHCRWVSTPTRLLGASERSSCRAYAQQRPTPPAAPSPPRPPTAAPVPPGNATAAMPQSPRTPRTPPSGMPRQPQFVSAGSTPRDRPTTSAFDDAWRTHTAPDGRSFWLNQSTGETRWSLPV